VTAQTDHLDNLEAGNAADYSLNGNRDSSNGGHAESLLKFGSISLEMLKHMKNGKKLPFNWMFCWEMIYGLLSPSIAPR
jgi:hypothetical protein